MSQAFYKPRQEGALDAVIAWQIQEPILNPNGSVKFEVGAFMVQRSKLGEPKPMAAKAFDESFEAACGSAHDLESLGLNFPERDAV